MNERQKILEQAFRRFSETLLGIRNANFKQPALRIPSPTIPKGYVQGDAKE